jgi:hypothetical protein
VKLRGLASVKFSHFKKYSTPPVDFTEYKRRVHRRNKKMQFLALIYEDEARFAQGYDEAEFAEYGTFGKKHAAAIKGGNALQPTPTAKTVRVRGGKVVTTDGPFAETKEQLGGYYLLEAAGIDEAAKLSAEIPGARFGSIEIRPIMVFS